MKRGFFVTGTGTGVGKTFVTALLARQGVARGLRVFAFKPIETGCSSGVGEDQEVLAKAAGDWQRGELRNLYCFERPLAPRAAARQDGRSVDLFHVEQAFGHGQREADLWLVEGAGGWRVPITDQDDMGSLAKRLGLPVLVVALAGLGTINHTLLTIEAIRQDECTLSAVVLSNRPEDDRVMTDDNAREIERLGRCVVTTTDLLDLDRLS